MRGRVIDIYSVIIRAGMTQQKKGHHYEYQNITLACVSINKAV